MKILTTLIFAALATAAAAQTAKTDTLAVKGMVCGMCENRIEKNIKKMSGVKAIEADNESEIVVVTFDPSQTSKDAIEQAISRIGYDAGKHPADKTARENLPGCCNPNAQK